MESFLCSAQETTESLSLCMLDRVVALEVIPVTIRTVVRPYMQEHGLNEDKMLFQYIGVGLLHPHVAPMVDLDMKI